MMANFVSTRPNLAFIDATRRSAASAYSRPPPNAAPSIAAMVGCGKSAIALEIERNFETNNGTSFICIEARSLRSAPAQNTPGTTERMINTRISSSFAN